MPTPGLAISDSNSLLSEPESASSESIPEDFELSEQNQKNTQANYLSNIATAILDPRQLINKLDQWLARCLYCLSDREDCICPRERKELIGAKALDIQKRVRLERYSGCFDCFLSQSICPKWEAREEGGYKRAKSGIEYRGKGALREFLALRLIQEDIELQDWFKGIGQSYSIRIDSEKDIYQIIGRRVRIGGVETNELCRSFWVLD